VTAHESVRAAVLDHASDLARWFPNLGADLAERMTRRELSPKEALRVLTGLRERHADENWLRPKAPPWEVCLVRDHAHMSVVAFLAEVGCRAFGEWFRTTFAREAPALNFDATGSEDVVWRNGRWESDE
jgi:hypothetical protein